MVFVAEAGARSVDNDVVAAFTKAEATDVLGATGLLASSNTVSISRRDLASRNFAARSF